MSAGPVWDPQRYLAFAGERGRPFVDLIGRIAAPEPRVVVDLGCGPGNLTALLADRWPDAAVTGLDGSAEMVRAAAASPAAERVAFTQADVRDWVASAPPGGVDVVVSNAMLQWVPGHLDLLPGLVAALAPGGWLAFQVPGNAGAPSHRLLDELAAEEPYAAHTAGSQRVAAHDAATYLRALQGLGCVVDAWETTYLHVLRGEDPVFAWISGTGARPTLQALPADLRPGFEAELKARLRTAYPDDGHGAVLAFRRIFVVAHRGEGALPEVVTGE